MEIALNIDGIHIKAKKGMTVLEAAKKAGIYIPTLCDHSMLKPAGSCRLCIVEIDGMRGYPPSCTTPIVEGMVVKTENPRLRSIRRSVLELTLSEHPYTCLVCDKRIKCNDFQGTIRKVGVTTGCQYCPKNGSCELQELVEYLELDEMEFPIDYHNLPVEQEDPFFDRDYNLCILCGRCVRVCNEVRGNGTLTFGFRGEQTVVGTAFGKSHLDTGCEFCGACVDVCPTGALYDKRSKWEGCPDKSISSVCPHCSVGCTLSYNLSQDKLISTTPHQNGTLNGQICMRGRFGVVDTVDNSERLQMPLVKKEGRWVQTSWDNALELVAEKLIQYQGDPFAHIASPQGTNEDGYLLQKFARIAMKSNSVCNSSELGQKGFVEPLVDLRTHHVPFATIDDIEKAGVIVVWGGDLSVSHPIVSLRVNQAKKNGAKLIVVDQRKSKLAGVADMSIRLLPRKDLILIAALMKEMLSHNTFRGYEGEGWSEVKRIIDKEDFSSLKKETGVSDTQLKELASLINQEASALFLFGSDLVLNQSSSDGIKALANLTMLTNNAKILPVLGESNLMGCLEMGCHPDLLPGLSLIHTTETRKRFEKVWDASLEFKSGRDLSEIVQGINENKIRCMFIAGEPPHLDCLRKLEFLVVQNISRCEWMDLADVILPAAHLNETEGTVINFEGRVQRVRKILKPKGEAKPDWWICSQIGQKMGVKGFSFKNATAVFKEIVSVVPGFHGMTLRKLGKKGIHLSRAKQKNEKSIQRFLPLRIDHEDAKPVPGYPIKLIMGWNLSNYRSVSFAKYIPGMKQVLSNGKEVH